MNFLSLKGSNQSRNDVVWNTGITLKQQLLKCQKILNQRGYRDMAFYNEVDSLAI